jgi:hypothetical protein
MTWAISKVQRQMHFVVMYQRAAMNAPRAQDDAAIASVTTVAVTED